jgi:predicted transcriptional regulator
LKEGILKDKMLKEFNKEYFFNLISAAYEVTKLFPEEEPLKFEIRKKNLKLLSDLMSCSPNPGVSRIEDKAPLIIKDIKIIKDFLDLAESQEMADSRNFLVLKREYDKIIFYLKEKIEKTEKKEEKPSFQNPEKEKKNNYSLTPRQERIVKILKEKKAAQAGEILNYFDEVTKRTLRRDLGRLSEMGVIKRTGKANQIFYEISQ